MNDYSNIKIKEQIENEISKDYIIYSQKFKKINQLLKDLVKNKIQFIGDENYYKLIDEFTTCIVKIKIHVVKHLIYVCLLKITHVILFYQKKI